MHHRLKTLLTLVLFSSFLQPLFVFAGSLNTTYDPNELSAGIYWFGLNGLNHKYEAGVPNPYFDPNKPTLIFVHGWQPYLSYNLPNFDYNGTDTAAAWISAGWNVGIFVWNQFSDETTGTLSGDWFANGNAPQGVFDAEAKIWTNTGSQGMRWRDWDDLGDSYGVAPAGTPSAAELFYQEFVAAMTEQPYTGGKIRIAGHSLGNQMAVRFAKLLHDNIVAGNVPGHLRPGRVVLLDPYWSPGSKSYLGGKSNAEMVLEYIAELLPTGTLFEWYWSSEWTTPPEADANEALRTMVLYAEMTPDFATSNKDKHMAAQHLYFWSYAYSGPSACTGTACLDMTKLLAHMSDDQLAAVMRSDYAWLQTDGNLTATPSDDVYQSQLRSEAPYTVTQLTADPQTQRVDNRIALTATVNNSAGLVDDGTLVTFSTDLGDISERSATVGGLALAQISSSEAGIAHITATTEGLGGTIQQTITVTFSNSDNAVVYLPIIQR